MANDRSNATVSDDTERPSILASLEVLLPGLEAVVPAILDEVTTGLDEVSPRYATFLRDRFEEVRIAAVGAMQLLLYVAAHGPNSGQAETQVDASIHHTLFEEIGRAQWREGQQIGTLLSAYQLGARATWHHLSNVALQNGIEPPALSALAESVFSFVDQLSSSSTSGYLSEQAESSAERERARDELVETLLSERSSSATVRAAAHRAGWLLPAAAAVVFVEPDNEVGRAALARLDRTCLAVRQPGLIGAIIPDPSSPGRRQRLETLLRGSSAVVGHAVAIDRLGASARIAEVAVRLHRDGVLRGDPVFVDRHLDAVIVHREPQLLATLQQSVLAPLDAVSPAARETLRDTLTSWLRHMGDRRAIAAHLQVHPQTVRYRMARLRDLFGSALDDPDYRLALTLALSWQSSAITSRTESR